MKKENKEDKKDKKGNVIILIVLSILLGVSFVVFIIYLDNKDSQTYYKAENYNPQIYFSEKITTTKQAELKDLINSLKPDYALTLDEVTFTSNRTFMDNLCGIKCLGQNRRYTISNVWHSQIYVYVDNDRERVKKTLCHEIIHNFLKSGKDYEKFVYDLASQGVCYG